MKSVDRGEIVSHFHKRRGDIMSFLVNTYPDPLPVLPGRYRYDSWLGLCLWEWLPAVLLDEIELLFHIAQVLPRLFQRSACVGAVSCPAPVRITPRLGPSRELKQKGGSRARKW